MEERTLLEEMEAKVNELIEKIDRLPVGSEEHSRACEDLAKLYRVFIEHYKAERDLYNQYLKIENEKEKDEKEIEIKERLAELEEMRKRFDWIKILAPCITIGLLTAGVCVYEAKGHILPNGLLRFVGMIKLPIL